MVVFQQLQRTADWPVDVVGEKVRPTAVMEGTSINKATGEVLALTEKLGYPNDRIEREERRRFWSG